MPRLLRASKRQALTPAKRIAGRIGRKLQFDTSGHECKERIGESALRGLRFRRFLHLSVAAVAIKAYYLSKEDLSGRGEPCFGDPRRK
jgi:hypothetical protein